MNTFADRLRFARQRENLSQARLGLMAGVPQGTLTRLETGRSTTRKHIFALATALKVNPVWLASGKTPANTRLPETAVRMRAESSLPDSTRSGQPVWIDRFEYACRAGYRSPQWNLTKPSALSFEPDFFQSVGSNPANCRLLSVRDNNMAPYLFDGDLMLIDDQRTIIEDGRTYVLYMGAECCVRRMFTQPDGGWSLRSYNPFVPDMVIAANARESIHVLGEVIYRAGRGIDARD